MTNYETTHQKPDKLSDLKHDFLASIVVFLVALPLCMGIALASGVPVAAGLITGIVGGIVAGALAGCPLQVSGPAAGLTVIIYDIVQRFGLEMLGVIVLIAGAIQVLAGLLKLGQWFRAVSPAVIKGMLAGIGVLIFASQFHVMVDDKPKGSGLENLLTIPDAVAKGLAVPDFSSREQREFRTEMLRAVGEIHRRQVDLYERVAERVPHHGALPSPSEEPQPAIALSDLAAEQEQITQELTAISQLLQVFGEQHPEKARPQRAAEAAAAALADSESALAALRQERLEAVPATQTGAITSLETLLAANKNHHLAAIFGVMTILVILCWQGFAPKKLKIIPAPLVALILATGLTAALVVPILYVEVPDNLWTQIHYPSLAVINSVPWSALLQAGLLIAVVASAETLLCATAVDQMQRGQRTRYDRELFAQGVGNMTCGVLGALPMTGVIVRSSANIQAGGRTRLSAILHGIWLLLFVTGLVFLLRLIPTAALAAILVYTGYKLVNPKSIKELYRYGWGEVVIYAATVITIVSADLLTGVLVGIALAAVKLLYTFSHLSPDLEVAADGHRATLSLNGAATFIRLPKLATALERVPPQAELHVDFQHLDYIDHACLDLLMNWAKQHETTGGKLVIDWDSLHARFHPDGNRKPAQAATASPKGNGVAKENGTAALTQPQHHG